MIKYVFTDAPVAIKNAKGANPQRIGSALAKIMGANDGKLRPKDIVEASRDPKNALHRHLEWRDDIAAEAYRIEQAREIVRIVKVQVDDGPITRAFLSVNDGKTSYRATGEVQGSVHLQDLVLRAAVRELQAFQRRYAEIEEICADLKAAEDKITARLKKAA
mgnify:CR=1 FL=1